MVALCHSVVYLWTCNIDHALPMKQLFGLLSLILVVGVMMMTLMAMIRMTYCVLSRNKMLPSVIKSVDEYMGTRLGTYFACLSDSVNADTTWVINIPHALSSRLSFVQMVQLM